MKKQTFLALVLVLISTQAFALKEYYGLSRSIRSLGMGGAFYGLSNDEYALFYNPAGLSVYDTDWEGMFRINSQVAPSTISALQTLTNTGTSNLNTIITNIEQYQGTPLYAGVGLLPYFVKRNFAVGLLLADTKVDMALLGKDLDSYVDATVISDSGLVIGYGRSFFSPDLHLGINAKGILRGGGRKTFSVVEIAQNQGVSLDPQTIGGIGAGVDFDLGATYELHDLPFGKRNRVSLVFSNLLASPFTISRQGSGAIPKLNRALSLGTYSVFPGAWLIDDFHVLLDFAEVGIGGESDAHLGARSGSLWKHVNLGVEMPMQGWFVVRAGLHQGYLSGGFGINLKFMRLDFATYAEELSQGINRLQSRRFALSLAFGAAGSPQAPVGSAKGSAEKVESVKVPEKEVEPPPKESPTDSKAP